MWLHTLVKGEISTLTPDPECSDRQNLDQRCFTTLLRSDLRGSFPTHCSTLLGTF